MRALAIALALALTPAPGLAQDFEAGLAAYDRGDYDTALQEWRPLAAQGVASAQYNLGWMYAQGRGVAQDHAEAVRWYRLAAEQGVAGAQDNLGLMYYLGDGVAQDYVSAHMWANIAAANGTERARELRDTVASKMTPADISEAQRRARVCMASGYQDCD